MSRVESILGSMGEDFATSRAKLATIETELANQKASIVSVEANWKYGLEEVKQSIAQIALRLEERDKASSGSRLTMATIVVSVGIAVVGANAFYVQSSISQSVSPLEARVTGLERMLADHHDLEERSARSTAADARSEIDRSDLNRRMAVQEDRLSKSIAEQRAEDAKLESAFTEAETQFKGLTGQVYYLWRQVTGTEYPVIPRENPMGSIQR